MTSVVTRYLIHPKYLYNWNDRSFHRDPRDLDRCTRSNGGTAFQRHSIFVWLSSDSQSCWRVVYWVCAENGQAVKLQHSPWPHVGLSCECFCAMHTVELLMSPVIRIYTIILLDMVERKQMCSILNISQKTTLGKNKRKSKTYLV